MSVERRRLAAPPAGARHGVWMPLWLVPLVSACSVCSVVAFPSLRRARRSDGDRGYLFAQAKPTSKIRAV